MSPKRVDSVEAMLRKADAALDDWFRQSRITSQEASAAFARFLDRSTRQGAGVLRQQVDGLQAGLKKLSSGLEHVEKSRREAAKTGRATSSPKSTRTRKTTTARKARVARKAAVTRKSRKAA
jgi:hypothetical protein